MVAPADTGVAVGVVRDANILVYFEVPELVVTAAGETVPGVNFDPELNADFGFETRKLETVVVALVVFGVFTVAVSLEGCVEFLLPNHLEKVEAFVSGVDDFTVIVVPGVDDFTVLVVVTPVVTNPGVDDFTVPAVVIPGVDVFTVVAIKGVDDFTVVITGVYGFTVVAITGVYDFTVVVVAGVNVFTVVVIPGADDFAAEVK